MADFLKKQLSSAENKKLGRTERQYEFTKDGGMNVTHRAADQKTKPRMVPQFAIPAGDGMGVKKPG